MQLECHPKKGLTFQVFFEYTVYPLEGFWDLTEIGRKSNFLLKDELIYTIMIKQPSFVTKDIFETMLNIVKKTKDNPYFEKLYFKTINEGLSIQMLHIGSYDEEQKTFEIMKEYLKSTNYEIKSLVHKEIYLSDPRKTEPSKLNTILRYHIKEKVMDK